MSYEIELPNYVLLELQKDEHFFTKISTTIDNILNNSKEKLGKNKNSVILDNETTCYLIYKNDFTITVYVKEKSDIDTNLFASEIHALDNGSKIYSNKILSFCFKENPTEVRTLEFIKQSYTTDILEVISQSIYNTMGLTATHIGLTFTTYQVGELLSFSSFLEKKFQVPNLLTKEQISKYIKNSLNNNKNPLLPIEAETIILLNFLNNHSKKYSIDNQYTFNDLDNHLYHYKNGFFLTDQNFDFFVIPQGEKDKAGDYQNFVVYSGSDYKKLSKEDLRKAINNNSFDYFDDITLEIKNGKIVYYYPSDIYSFFFNFKHTAHHFSENENTPIIYPVDILSFDYQKNYFYSEYGMSKMDFLTKALLVLGSGFTYDSEQGTFYSPNIPYLTNIKKEISKTIDNEQNKKATLNFLSAFYTAHLKNVTYLNEEWFSALSEVKDVLYNYKLTTKRITESDIVKLDNSIEDVDALIEKLNNKANKNNTTNNSILKKSNK